MIFDFNKIYNDNIEEFKIINNIIENEGVSLFGSGEFGYRCAKYLIDNNYNINYFIDSDINKQGKKIYDIEIIHKNSDLSKNIKVVLISTNKYIDEIIAENKSNYNYIIPFDKWFIMKNFNRLVSMHNYFYDERSKEIFDTILYCKYNGAINKLADIFEKDHYFAINNFLSDSKKQIFVDLGAYVGDTVEKFVENCEGIFDKIYAFEPGNNQFIAMNSRVNRLIEEWAINKESIVLEKLGVSNINKEVFFDVNCDILSNNITDNETDTKIKVVSLDNYFDGNPITFLKSDIEGEELNMLKGASETIKKYKPKMAISIYHKPDDFFTIPEFIKSLVPEYKFYLRHHSITYAETVLYCCI